MNIKEKLINLFELDKMEPEKAIETIDRLAKLVFQGVLTRVLPTLSDADFDTYEKIVDSNEGGEKILSFLGGKVPDFDKIVEEEAEIIRVQLNEEFEKFGVK